MTALHVGIDVRVTPGLAGGVAPAVARLIEALGSTGAPERYSIIVGSDAQAAWLRPILGPRQTLVKRPEPGIRLIAPIRPAIRRIQNWLSPPRYWPEVPLSDGFYESLGCDLMHFPTQHFTVCAVPSVYNPIDLQHLHYPGFFDALTIAWRETVYRSGCRLAHAVVVNSEWIKRDVIGHYHVDPARVHVIREAPATASSRQPSDVSLDALRKKYQLGREFVLYPAVTWPHKNHLRLFEALAELRDRRGMTIDLVCTGSRYEAFWPKVEEALNALSLNSQVHFVGHVPQEDLRGLYRWSTCLVLPSLFEANSLPIFEAWLEGTPVASSNATALPEQVGDAGLLFDPLNPSAIAEALAAIAVDGELRATLRDRGFQRATEFSWDLTANAYRLLYRRVAFPDLPTRATEINH